MPPSSHALRSAPAKDTHQNPCVRCASRLQHTNAPRTTYWQQLKAYLCHKIYNHTTSPHCYCPAPQPQPPTNASTLTLSSTPHPLKTQCASLARRPLSWAEWVNTGPERETGPTTRTTRARPTIMFADASTPALPRGGGSLERQAAATGGAYCLVAGERGWRRVVCDRQLLRKEAVSIYLLIL